MEFAIAIFILLFYLAIAVGLYVLFIWICGKIARDKGLPESYKWFGFLGVIGIIIVAVSTPKYPQYPPQYPQNPQNGYGNPYQQNNTYFGNQPNQANQPYQPNTPQQDDQAQPTSFCPHCGAPVDNYAVVCGMCGKQIR